MELKLNPSHFTNSFGTFLVLVHICSSDASHPPTIAADPTNLRKLSALGGALGHVTCQGCRGLHGFVTGKMNSFLYHHEDVGGGINAFRMNEAVARKEYSGLSVGVKMRWSEMIKRIGDIHQLRDLRHVIAFCMTPLTCKRSHIAKSHPL